jgi:hypothetical protein
VACDLRNSCNIYHVDGPLHGVYTKASFTSPPNPKYTKASGVIWVSELGFGCHLGPNTDVARSYMWGPHVSRLYFYFGGTVAIIYKIFQKLYLFHMISDEDDFYIKNVALDEIYNFLVLSF